MKWEVEFGGGSLGKNPAQELSGKMKKQSILNKRPRRCSPKPSQAPAN
jgi:hypothetical protein